MARVFWTPDPADDGLVPSDLAFVIPWHAVTSVLVQDLGGGEAQLVITYPGGSNDRRGVMFTEIAGFDTSALTDVELYVEYTINGSAHDFYAVARMGGDDTSEGGVWARRRRQVTSGESMGTYDAGTSSTLAADTASTTDFRRRKIRLRPIGTSLRSRFWDSADAEPGTWTFDQTNNDVSGAGGVGVSRFENSNASFPTNYIHAIGVGTGGDSAPTEPVAGGGTTFDAGPGTLHLTGQQGDFTTGTVLSAGAGALQLTGQQATLSLPQTFTASPGQLHLGGQPATLARPLTLTAQPGALQLTGQQGAFTAGQVFAAQPDTLHLTGQPATLSQPLTLVAGAGALQLTGQQATLAQPLTLTAAPGTLQLAGQQAAITLGQTLVATPGQLTLEGQSATLPLPLTLTAQPGVLQLTGQQAALATALVLTAGSGIIELVGQQAVFTAGAPELPPAGRLFRARLESRRFQAVAPQRYFRG